MEGNIHILEMEMNMMLNKKTFFAKRMSCLFTVPIVSFKSEKSLGHLHEIQANDLNSYSTEFKYK